MPLVMILLILFILTSRKERDSLKEKNARPKEIGRIHSLETFGTVDGPGIRFVIFFKGCSLRCQYCHNPDT